MAAIAIQFGDGQAMRFMFEARVVARRRFCSGLSPGRWTTATILRLLASLLRLDGG